MNVSSSTCVDTNIVEKVASSQTLRINRSNHTITNQLTVATAISEMTDEHGQPTEQAYQTAVKKMNEFMEYSQKNSKFVFHKDLQRYYVEIVDAKTQSIIKEIPPKELLDAYYEMQKFVGKIFDTQA